MCPLFIYTTSSFHGKVKIMWKMFFMSFRKYCRRIVNMSYQIRVFCQRLMLKTLLFKNQGTEVDTINCSLMRKPFIEYIFFIIYFFDRERAVS